MERCTFTDKAEDTVKLKNNLEECNTYRIIHGIYHDDLTIIQESQYQPKVNHGPILVD